MKETLIEIKTSADYKYSNEYPGDGADENADIWIGWASALRTAASLNFKLFFFTGKCLAWNRFAQL